MALEPLATDADLTARGILTEPADRVEALLAAASDAVRGPAGCTISEHTGTVSIEGAAEQWLQVPGWAIRDVTDVQLDAAEVTDFRLIGGRLWRAGGWQAGCGPSLVTMTVTQGLAEVPADIIDLVCSLVAGGQAAAEDGYDPKRGMSYERIDDYQYGMSSGDNEIVSPMELPERTKASLAQRFGNAAFVTEGAR